MCYDASACRAPVRGAGHFLPPGRRGIPGVGRGYPGAGGDTPGQVGYPRAGGISWGLGVRGRALSGPRLISDLYRSR